MKRIFALLMLGTIIVIGGCGKENNDILMNETIENQFDVEVQDDKQEISDETVVMNIDENVYEDSTEIKETNSGQTIEEWVKSLELEEEALAIWNENTYQGKLLEEAEVYQMQEGDCFLLCSNSVIEAIYGSGIDTFSSEGYEYGGTYIKYNVKFYKEYEYSISIKTVDSDDYIHLLCTLLAPEGQTYEATEEETKELECWVESLQLSQASVAVWNENECKGRLLENEEVYQVVEGDWIVLCSPLVMDMNIISTSCYGIGDTLKSGSKYIAFLADFDDVFELDTDIGYKRNREVFHLRNTFIAQNDEY